ncbi:unnamed protein product [Orchesella dallaii]|uniref:Uncharacterized protein n=1 Tax=Orchesella dallaii TaxID=48710 RepID=A0ABP1QL13_9HEXA
MMAGFKNFGTIKTFGVICLLLASMAVNEADAGLGLGALCSAGCATMAVACYSAAGAVFGTVTAGIGTAPAILACNAAFGTCMGNCAIATAAPTP